MKRSLLAAVLSMSALAGAQPTQPVEAPATQPLAPEVAALLQQLADPDPAKVAAARSRLIGLGEVARPALEQFLKPRATADDVLSAIETNKVAAATIITMKVADATIDDVLNELSKHAGYPLRMYNRNTFRPRNNNNELQTYTLEYENQPFWDVLKDVCAKASISPYNDNQGRRGMLFMPSANVGGSMFACPSSSSGAALCALTQLSRSNNITFGPNNSSSNSFNAQLNVMFEPKVRLISYWYSPQIDEAVDDNGNSLINRNNSSSGTNGVGRQTQVGMGISLTYPSTNPGTKIARLRGKARFVVATRFETVEITDLTKEQTYKSPAGRRMLFKNVKPQGNDPANGEGGNPRQYNVQVTFYRDNMEQQRFYEQSNSPSVRMVDANGRELRYQHNSRSDNNDSEMNVTMVFYRAGRNEGNEDDVGEPVKLFWDVATDSKEISIPFEFSDLPMP